MFLLVECYTNVYFLVNFFNKYFIEFYQSWPGKGANKLQPSLVSYCIVTNLTRSRPRMNFAIFRLN